MKNFKHCPMCAAILVARETDGRNRSVCPACGWIHYKNPVPAVSCLVKDQKGRVLLVKRGIEPYIGEWSIPGGFIEIKETIPEAGSRELLEETGLIGKPGRLVGATIQKGKIYAAVLIVAYEYIVKDNSTLTAGDDAQDAAFFAPEKIPRIPLESHRYLIKKFLEM